MKQGWQIKKLGEICESRLGKTLNSTTDKGKLRPYLCAVNVQWDRFDLSYVKEALFENDEIEKYTAKKGDLLVCEGGETGRAAIWDKDEPIQYQNALHRIRFKDNTIIPRFCLHYLHFLKLSGVLDKEYSHGATILHLVTKSLYSIPIPVPSISEQQRIVALLDAEFAKIDVLKANAEKNLQNAKDLFQAALNKLIIGGSKGWKSTKLKTICSKIGSGATPLGGKSTYGKEGVSLIRSLNVHNNEFHYEDLAHINEEQAKQLSNVEIIEDDVLFNITGASVTRCCKVPKDVLPARVNQHVSILRLLPETLLPNFLVYTMISPHHNTALMKMAENGATRQAITKKQLEEWVIEYPETIADQQSIVARLDVLNEKCKTLQANYEKTLSLCDDLKQALLRKAFNGEI